MNSSAVETAADDGRLDQAARDHVQSVVTGSGTSFFWAMRAYGLAKEDFLALIDGMEMDAAGFSAPPIAELELYCDRVASAVGRLSVRAFGATEADARNVAIHLGQALQLTNILRDLKEDAERGRLYLPSELLDSAGIRERDPNKVLAHPNLSSVCDTIAAKAEERFANARRAIAKCARAPMRPAVVMMHVYHGILEALCRRGWTALDQRARLSKPAKLWIALRYGIF